MREADSWQAGALTRLCSDSAPCLPQVDHVKRPLAIPSMLSAGCGGGTADWLVAMAAYRCSWGAAVT